MKNILRYICISSVFSSVFQKKIGWDYIVNGYINTSSIVISSNAMHPGDPGPVWRGKDYIVPNPYLSSCQKAILNPKICCGT
jgi:hypothetical protein